MVGSCGSVLVLPGSPSGLRRKDGQTCTCLSTLLLISSKVDMVADLRAEMAWLPVVCFFISSALQFSPQYACYMPH